MTTPPPSPRERRTPPCWEAELLVAWDARLMRMARKLWHPERLAMDVDDVHADLRISVLLACRRFAREHNGERPPDPWVFTVANRRWISLVRLAMSPERIAESRGTPRLRDDHGEDVGEIEVASAAPLADERIEKEDIDLVCAGLVYALQRSLTPAAFGVLYLRYIEELETSEIAALVGRESPDLAHRRLSRAKELAQLFLRSLGVATWEQLAETGAKDYDASEFDQPTAR